MDRHSAYATRVFLAAGYDQVEPVSMERLARGLRIRLAQESGYGGLALGGLVRDADGMVLWTRRGLQVVRRREVQMRVIAEWFLRMDGLRAATAATLARSVGASLLVPAEPLTRAWASTDGRPMVDRLTTLSLRFGAPSACVALRVGEVTRRPVAAVTPTRVIRAGDWQLEDEDLREMATSGPMPGFVRVACPDRDTHVILAPDSSRSKF